ncbi:Hint domain-containing protein [Aestuariibius sp. 2305UL40-4]|uniref:Hint domain-containing protein n=1 Tax=Aestuariibius violaceus TaxID=3234132 RepID=UPI00345E64E8
MNIFENSESAKLLAATEEGVGETAETDALRDIDRFDPDRPVGAMLPALTPGTRMSVDHGEVAVEYLRPGDLLRTKDNGLKEIRWIGERTIETGELTAAPHLYPISIAAGALGLDGPDQQIIVSPGQAVLYASPQVELVLGTNEALVRSEDLLGVPGVDRYEVAAVTYFFLMFDAHEIIRANGLWMESFQPDLRCLEEESGELFEGLFAVFPRLATLKGRTAYRAARVFATAGEVKLLFAP